MVPKTIIEDSDSALPPGSYKTCRPTVRRIIPKHYGKAVQRLEKHRVGISHYSRLRAHVEMRMDVTLP